MKTLSCPGCARPMVYTERQAGKRVRCSRCRSVVTLPGEPAGVFAPDPRVGVGVARQHGSSPTLATARRPVATPLATGAAAGAGEALARKARAALARGDDDRVIALCNRQLALEPERVDVFVNLAFALQRQNRTDEALALYGQLRALEPDNEVWDRWISFLEARRRASLPPRPKALPRPEPVASLAASGPNAPRPGKATLLTGALCILLGVGLVTYSSFHPGFRGGLAVSWGLTLLGSGSIGYSLCAQAAK